MCKRRWIHLAQQCTGKNERRNAQIQKILFLWCVNASTIGIFKMMIFHFINELFSCFIFTSVFVSLSSPFVVYLSSYNAFFWFFVLFSPYKNADFFSLVLFNVWAKSVISCHWLFCFFSAFFFAPFRLTQFYANVFALLRIRYSIYFFHCS